MLCLTPLLALLCSSDPKGKKRPLLSTGQPGQCLAGRVLVGARPAVSRRPIIATLKAEKRPIHYPTGELIRGGEVLKLEWVQWKRRLQLGRLYFDKRTDHHVGNQLQR